MVTLVIALVIAGLAVARITTLIVHDTILEPLRREVFLLSPPSDDLDLGRIYQQVDRVPWRSRKEVGGQCTMRGDAGPRSTGFVGVLLSCDRCVGVWAAIAVVGGYVTLPDVTVPVVLVAAVAQLALIATRAGEA